MDKVNFAENLQVGDTIFTKSDSNPFDRNRRIPFIAWRIIRFTPTRVVVERKFSSGKSSESAFFKTNGRLVGGTRRQTAFVPTPEQVLEQRRAVLIRKTQNAIYTRMESRKEYGAIDQYDEFWLAIHKTVEEFERKSALDALAAEAQADGDYDIPKTACAHAYSRSILQDYPRKCLHCGETEPDHANRKDPTLPA